MAIKTVIVDSKNATYKKILINFTVWLKMQRCTSLITYMTGGGGLELTTNYLPVKTEQQLVHL